MYSVSVDYACNSSDFNSLLVCKIESNKITIIKEFCHRDTKIFKKVLKRWRKIYEYRQKQK
jgi:hypothetical protein